MRAFDIGKRKLRAPLAPKHWKTYTQIAYGLPDLQIYANTYKSIPICTNLYKSIQIYTNLCVSIHVSAGPLCGAHGCEDHHCPQSLSTVTSQQTVSYSHCPLYCTPPLMVPRQARRPQNTINPEVVLNWLGAFCCTGVMRERQKPRNIGKRKPRASAAPKHWKT